MLILVNSNVDKSYLQFCALLEIQAIRQSLETISTYRRKKKRKEKIWHVKKFQFFYSLYAIE